ncbi:MAG: hypothetical protein N2D54_07665 [Chloroflexota bacterium]
MASLQVKGKIQAVITRSRFPNTERISIMFASISLAYALTQFINSPSQTYFFSILGILIPIKINFQTLVTVAVTIMTASGTNWLMDDGQVSDKEASVPHWLLPALTAWIISILLITLPLSLLWWGVFLIGGLFLLTVVLAEYIVKDPQDVRHPFAAAGLTALGYTVFIILAISLRSTKTRLILTLPALGFTAGLICLRALHLRLQGKRQIPQSIAATLIIMQLAAGLHYFAISSISYGMVLLGAIYFMINFMINNDSGFNFREAIREPLISMGIIWLIAIWV